MAMLAPLLAAAGSAGGAAATGGSLFTFGNIMTGISAVSTVAGGISSMQAGKVAEEQAAFNARTEELNARKEACSINEELLETMASNRVAMAVGGIQSSGSAARAQEMAQRKAGEELSTIRFNTEQRQSDLRLQGAQASKQGKVAFAGSLFEAAESTHKQIKKIKGT